jgi:hypothetical protein
MPKSNIIIAAALSMMPLAGNAAPPQQPLHVYDAKGTSLGRLAQVGLFFRQYGNQLYEVQLDSGGLKVNASFVYTSADCGQSAHDKAYAQSWWDGLYNEAQFDGETIWTSAQDFKVIIANSYSWFWDTGNYKVTFQCYRLNASQQVVTTPVRLETAPQWAPSCQLDLLEAPQYPLQIPLCKPLLTVR